MPDWNTAIRPDRNWLREKSPLSLVSDAGGATWSLLISPMTYPSPAAACGLSKVNWSLSLKVPPAEPM